MDQRQVVLAFFSQRISNLRKRASGLHPALLESEPGLCPGTGHSGLLRFNDIHLVAPELRPTYSVVADETRRDRFVRQLRRPTFEAKRAV